MEDGSLDAGSDITASAHRDHAPVARAVPAPHPLLYRELAEAVLPCCEFYRRQHGVWPTGVDSPVAFEGACGVEHGPVRPCRTVHRRHPCAREIPGEGSRPCVSEPEVDVVRNSYGVETPAQDLEWREAYTAS